MEVQHQELLKTYVNANYARHNNYFWHRILTLSEEVYDQKFETLLLFLVEAIGVPVLLSLLVLIFTAGGEDLTKLPSNRIELYELGIESAISKRLLRGGSQMALEDRSTDMLIHEWMRLFNLDRGQMNTVVTEKKKEERSHKPTRKAAMKFEDLRGNADYDAQKKMQDQTASGQSQQEKAVWSCIFFCAS